MPAIVEKQGNATLIGAAEEVLVEANTATIRDSVVQVFPSPQDPAQEQVLHLLECSGVLDFWNDAGEDIYTKADGEQLT